MMTKSRRKIEIFSAGCSCCEEAVALIRQIACPSCEVTILDMSKPDVAERARHYGVRSVPAVVVDGRLAGCCEGRGPDTNSLRAAGVGSPL